ncbi:hypothetical protein F5887DRAFT_907363 [Amanita rubescens]|nr:hypothetical protein F5887DRAFT_907363 [Amanita rubescens]
MVRTVVGFVCLFKLGKSRLGNCRCLRIALQNPCQSGVIKPSLIFIRPRNTYHYSNHRATDQLCREWCNPAPMNGSAPNLVIAGRTAEGELYYKRAFNTQACEQLNAWLGGYEQILKRMTSGNFNWFLHTMLFYHTRHVINNQLKQEKSGPQVDGDDDGGVGIDVDDSFE